MAILITILISSTALASIFLGTLRQTITFLGFALAGIITFFIANSLVIPSSIIFWGSISSICSYISLWVVGQNSKTLQMTIYLGLALATTTNNLLGLGVIHPILTFTFIFISNYSGSGLKVISEIVSGSLGTDPGELELNKETESLSILDKVETKSLYNWAISSFFTIMTGLMLFHPFLSQYSSLVSNVAMAVSPFVVILTWGYYFYRTPTKMSLLLGAGLSGIILFLSINSFNSLAGLGSMGVMMALSFLFESSNKAINSPKSKILRKVLTAQEPRCSLHFHDSSNDNHLYSLALRGGLASSFFIGLPTYLYNLTFIAPDTKRSQDKLGFFWISDIISEHFGLFVFFIWGLSRTGISDTLGRFQLNMTSEVALTILVISLFLNLMVYYFRKEILEIYTWLLLDVDLLSQNVWVSKAKFAAVPLIISPVVSPTVIFLFLGLAFLIPRVFQQYKFPSIAVMLPLSFLPIYNLAIHPFF